MFIFCFLTAAGKSLIIVKVWQIGMFTLQTYITLKRYIENFKCMNGVVRVSIPCELYHINCGNSFDKISIVLGKDFFTNRKQGQCSPFHKHGIIVFFAF